MEGVPYHTISTGEDFTAVSAATIAIPAGPAQMKPKALPSGASTVSYTHLFNGGFRRDLLIRKNKKCQIMFSLHLREDICY